MLKKFLSRFARTAPPQFDGAHSKNWWATRDDAAGSSAAGYWETRSHPSRMAIADEIAVLPGTSLLDVGIHAGPTMWAVCQKKRFERLAGTELSAVVLDFTREVLPQALGQDVELVQAAADGLPFESSSFDFVTACMVLICIGPEAIDASLNEMLRVSRRYIVLGEAYSAERSGRIDPYPNTSYWIRDYARLLKGRARLIATKMLPPEHCSGHMDCVLVFEKC